MAKPRITTRSKIRLAINYAIGTALVAGTVFVGVPAGYLATHARDVTAPAVTDAHSVTVQGCPTEDSCKLKVNSDGTWTIERDHP